jgi:dipeptidyl aminopeptidase/acylaminoacyl peptidase
MTRAKAPFLLSGLAALLVAAPAARAADPPAPALVPVMDFARKSVYESAKISPQGEYLAVEMPLGDQTVVGVLDLATGKPVGGLRLFRQAHVSDYWWVGPKRLVVSLAKKFGPLDQAYLTGELMAFDFDGKDRVYLFGYRGGEEIGTRLAGVTKEWAWAFMADPLPYEPTQALVSIVPWSNAADFNNPTIERIDVYRGTRKRVAVVEGFQPVDVAADRAGRLRFAYSKDIKNRYQLFAATGAGGELQRIEHPGGPPEAITLYNSSPDGSVVYLESEDAQGRDCLREYRFGAGFRDIACGAGEFGDPVFDFESSRPIGRLGDGPDDVEYFDEQHPDVRFRRMLHKAFAGQRVRITSRTLDGKRVVVFVESDRNPGDFYVVDRDTKKADRVVSRRKWIDPRAMTPVERIRYKARDGTEISAYLTAPGGKAARKLPLVLLPHGGPHGVRDRWEWHEWAQLLANRGYAVLQPNFRGSGGYGEAFETAGYRKWGTLMQDDLTDAVKWAVDAGIAAPGRACIFGASYGGYAALMSSVREPSLYRCAIAYAGVYDLGAQAAESDISDSYMGRSYLTRALGDEAAMKEHSPITYIDKLKAPVLIAHGTSDERVPFSQAKLLRKALDRHGKKYEWLEFSGEEHGFYDDKNHEAFLTKVLEFLDRHIGARATQPGG